MNSMKELLGEKKWVLAIAKYLFSLILVLVAYQTHENWAFSLVSFFELIIILSLTNRLLEWNKWLGYGFNSLLLFLFNAQNLVMYFGGSYTTLIMVTNLDSLESLSGHFFLYTTGTILLLIFTFLPVAKIGFKKVDTMSVLSFALIAELAFTFLYGNAYSPLFAVYRLGLDAKAHQEKLAAIADQPNVTSFFYHDEIKEARDKPTNLPENPNIVLVFVEGLSQNIVDDERAIMPSFKALQDSSLSFTNYYNHTFATYRGLIGQLYSGYQLDNLDTNSLVGIQDVLASKGYQTTFINTEPNNTQFTSYLESLNYQTLINDNSRGNGIRGSLTDQSAFELLYETMEAQAQTAQPFFTTMYTYGTHMSFDSPDKTFGDGNNYLLNRFHNFDYYFNAFITKFNQSSLSDNTILIFTTDHATFEDKDFTDAYPDYVRANSDVDRMPLFIYYKGVQQEKLDVEGRNSLSLVPTVLDYLDINVPNYFLGQSLFYYKENDNSYDTVFYDNTYLLSTNYGVIEPLSDTNKATLEELLQKYFAAKTQEPQE